MAREGAVNAPVARRLARGALERSPADVAIAVTGVLGPSPDEDGNPVGLVYFACCGRHGEPAVRRRDYGNRPDDVLRRLAVVEALQLLDAYIEAEPSSPV